MMVSSLIENAIERSGQPVRSGVFVAVVGPSGAGKDTLIKAAEGRVVDAAGDVLFVRRAITRAPEPDGENHIAMTDAEFDTAASDGVFAVAWTAHGLKYGIPAEVDRHIVRGQVAVANVSRAALPLVAERYSNVTVVNVRAPLDLLARRLASRGRESETAIRARLERADARLPALPEATVTIENTGSVEKGADLLVAEICRAIRFSDVSDSL